MKYLLIDTNGWMEVLQSDARDKVVDYLNHWKRIGAIELLVPEIIINKEWQVITNKYRSRTRDAHDTTATSMSAEGSQLPHLIRKSDEYIENRIIQVKPVLASGIRIKETSKLLVSMRQRQIKKQAPFHGKASNYDDALIYFSSVDWLVKNKIDSFIFLSTNVTDFSIDKQDNKHKLHRDLETKNLQCNYYTNLGHVFRELKISLPPLPEPKRTEDVDYTRQFFVTKDIQQLELIDQIHTALDAYHDQLPFIPLTILNKMFPFKIVNPKQSYTYYSAYSLTINNSAIITLFKSVELSKTNRVRFGDKTLTGKVQQPAKKMFTILNRLSNNQVQSIHTTNNIEVSIKIKRKGHCPCIQCRFWRFDFAGALELAKHKPFTDVRETMKNGYTAFRFGNFQTAFRLYYDAYKIAVATQKDVQSFICLYSLKILKDYSRGNFSKHDPSITKIFAEIDQTSSLEEMIGYNDRSGFARQNINWIAEDKFYLETVVKIMTVTDDIRKHYASQLKGGWSNNSNLRLLYSHFSELENYLVNNHVVFNSESVNQLYRFVFESLLMCYSFNKNQGSKLTHFTNFIVASTIRYCKAENLLEYFRRYNIESIAYEPGKEKTWQLDSITGTFFEDYPKLKDLMETKLDGEGYYFKEKTYQTILNLIMLFAYLDIKKRAITPFTQSLIKICQAESLFRKFDPKYLAEFIRLKGKYIESNTFINLLLTAIDNDHLHDYTIFNSLRHILLKHHRSAIIVDVAIYSSIINTFLAKCPKCNEYHHKQFLFDIYMMLSPTLQEDLQRRLVEKLDQKFDADDYYTWAIFDMIDYTIHFDKYVERFRDVNLTPGPISWPNTRKENILQEFNELLNLAFKHQIQIEQSILDSYKGFNNYYDWLLNMDGFDYKKFDPLWITLYGTDFYLKKIFAVKKIKQIIRDYLKLHPHPLISDYYITYATT